MKNRFLLFGGIFFLTGFSTLFFYVEEKKSSPGFCVSCHLSPTQKLHQKKYDGYREADPKNMAALHRKEIPCIGCHEGDGYWNKFAQAKKEGWNTLRYFMGTFEEPEKLSPPWFDANCVKCHQRLKAKELFHQAQAHGGKFVVRCTECHSSHKKGGKKEKYFIPQDLLREQCLRCHRDYPRAEEYVRTF